VTPRPFYRSRLFWLGLPGLVFLLWAWWLSTGHYSGAGFGGWVIGQMGGEVFARWDADGRPDWVEFGAGHRDMKEGEAQEMKGMLPAVRELFPSYRIIFIPYFWPVLAYTATWLLTLAWWQRRKYRISKLHTAP
jgi:hypothetical protein